MRFIQEYGYTVKVGQDEAHQRWLIENDAALKAAAPKGNRYIGTFAVIVGSEKEAGGYRALFELDSYGAMDAAAANHLVLTVKAAGLLGAMVIVTGLSPEIAQTLVHIGVDLGKMKTVGDLQGGIEEAERLLDLRKGAA